MNQSAIGIHRKKRGTQNPFARATHRCSACKTKYAKVPFKIIYKDVIECSNCGKVSILLDENDVMRYS
jgi:DNA-directed RNA polymerase subunit RPC12/RpoP